MNCSAHFSLEAFSNISLGVAPLMLTLLELISWTYFTAFSELLYLTVHEQFSRQSNP
jgi:hypothetical protein